MKVILANRDERGHLGGDAIQLRGYQNALRQLGHSAEYTNGLLYFDAAQYRYYDEMWSLHCNFDWSYWPFVRAKQAGIRFRLFPIFYKGVYVNITKEQIIEMVNYASDIYFLSGQEKNELLEELGFDVLKQTKAKIHFIPNGVDSSIFNTTGATETSPSNFIASSGRFAKDKGFHHIINACKQLDLPVAIFGASWDTNYRDELRNSWDKAFIVEQVAQPILAGFLRQANVYVCAAENERNNLALIEGIACGAKPISSPGNRGNTWFPGITVVNPEDEDLLAEAIKTAYSANKTEQTAYKIPDWKEVVKMILE